MDDFDGDSIRARRALLISTALAALHCGGPGDGAIPSATETQTASASVSSSAQTPPASASTPPVAAPLRPWADVLAAAPPRGVPAAVAGDEKRFLEGVEAELTARYEVVRVVWESTPACDPGQAACRPQWRELGAKFKTMYQSERLPRGAMCGGPSFGSGAVAARQREHARYLSKLVDEIDAHLQATADSYSPMSAQEWLKQAANAKEQPPMPCLSCAMPELLEISETVPFTKDSSALPAPASLTSIVDTFKLTRVPAKIVVRGHADAKESKTAELAKARAAAVASWLEKNGIAKDRIEVKSFDATWPIGRSETEAGANLNQRVDFEVVRL